MYKGNCFDQAGDNDDWSHPDPDSAFWDTLADPLSAPYGFDYDTDGDNDDDINNVEGVFIGEKIAALAFEQLEILKEKERAHVEHNRALMKNFMASESDRLSWVEPAAGVTCFPRLETGETGDDLAERLWREHDTAITPGSFFGAPEHVRIGFGGSSEYLSLGLEKISDALDSYQ